MATPTQVKPATGAAPINKWKPLPEVPKPPLRKADNGVGTVGVPIKLKANYYEVKVNNWNKQLVHYDVAIKQPGKDELDIAPSKSKKMEIFEIFKESNKAFFKTYKLAYDGMKSAVSVGVIPQLKDGKTYKVFVAVGKKRSQYDVILKIVNKMSLMELKTYLKAPRHKVLDFPATVFQMLEIMFRHIPTTKYTSVGQNSFFSKDIRDPFGSSFPISGDMMAQQGFFASLRPAAWKDGSLLLNIDVAHAVFYKEQPVLKFMEENKMINFDSRHNPIALTNYQRDKLKAKLKNLKVQVTHTPLKRTYKVIDIMKNGADKQMFQVKEDKYQSVQAYFEETYPRSPMRYPWLPLIRAAPDTRTVYLPIEFCKIAKGQRVSKHNLGAKETSSFVTFTAKPPQERLKNINDIAHNEHITKNEMVKDLELSFDSKPIELTGRILPAPGVQMQDNAIKPRFGKWDIRDSKFFQSKSILCWAVLNYSGIDNDQISKFVSEVIRMGKDRGMTIWSPIANTNGKKAPDIELPALKEKCENSLKERIESLEKEKVDLLRKEKVDGLQMIMVILATKNTNSEYAAVKRIGDRILRVPTQCVLSTNVMKMKGAIIGNILFKINAKMGGINNTLQDQNLFVLDRPVMVMGADVNHPPASDKSGIPSIAAVVGSLDKYAFSYAVEVRPQESRKEMILKLAEMTKSLLLTFRQKTGCIPQRIIMYRDGVSESQFFEVLAFELKALRSACTSLHENYKPGITFIVVQKRHHTRFFPVNEREGVGKNKNVPPGTVVDTDVTHPHEIDFYLCSHEGIQGTSKPTHYRVLWDDNDLSVDQLQGFSFAMCHLYARCARSVSIPTPAYYAHWAAYRGKTHLHEMCDPTNKDRPEYSHTQLCDAVRMDVENEINSKMYFL